MVRRSGGRPAWLVYLIAGAATVTGYYLVAPHGSGRPLRVVLYCAVSGSAAVAVFAGVRRHRPRQPLPWLLLGASQVVYAAADATFYMLHYVVGSASFPSPSDVLYLAHYPLVVAGLILLIRRRTPGRDLPGLLDAAAVAVAAGLLSWLFMIAPLARVSTGLLAEVTSLAYPVMDLAVLAVALRLILGGGRRSASFFLLIGNLVGILTADTVYGLQQLAGTYQAGNFLDAIWLGGNLMLGAGALHPTMRRLADRSPTQDQSLGAARIGALSAAALLAPATLLVQSARGATADIPVTASACALLFVLTIARMAGLVGEQRRLAISDGLTGLHTRRYLEAQLTVEVARGRRGVGTLGLFILDVDHFKSINDRYGHPAGDRALTEIAGRLRQAVRGGDVLARYGGEEFALLVPNTIPDQLPVIAERLREHVAGTPIELAAHTSVLVTVSVGAAALPEHANDLDQLVAVADRALYAAKAAGRDRTVIGAAGPVPAPLPGDRTPMADYLHHVADEVDAKLSDHEHSRAVARWARRVAGALGLDEGTARRTELAGRLHDVGKVVVPDSILAKAGPLTEPEWQLMRQHVDHGFRLASLVPGFAVIAEVIRQHHERYDGTGYPDQLRGAEIRLEARILAVCDSFAAMRADRTYQAALSDEQARAELRAGRGGQFDPAVVDAFLDLHEAGQLDELQRLHMPMLTPAPR